MTISVKRAGSNVLSAQLRFNEGCTMAESLNVEAYSEDNLALHNATNLIVEELYNHGILKIQSEQLRKYISEGNYRSDKR